MISPNGRRARISADSYSTGRDILPTCHIITFAIIKGAVMLQEKNSSIRMPNKKNPPEAERMINHREHADFAKAAFIWLRRLKGKHGEGIIACIWLTEKSGSGTIQIISTRKDG
jgi:hypothetical protein